MFCYRESGEAQREFQHEQEMSERMVLTSIEGHQYCKNLTDLNLSV